MIRQVGISRDTDNARYGDVLDGLEFLQRRYGSAANAAVHCIRESKIFIEAQAEMKKTKRVAVRK